MIQGQVSRLRAFLYMAREQLILLGGMLLETFVLSGGMMLLLLLWNLGASDKFEVQVWNWGLWAFGAIGLCMILLFIFSKSYKIVRQALYYEGLARQAVAINPDETVKYSKEAVNRLEALSKKDSRVIYLLMECCQYVGICARRSGKHVEAEVFRKKQLNYAIMAGNLRNQAEALLGLGQVKMDQGYWKDAESFLREAVTISVQTNNSRLQWWILDTLGEVVHFLGKSEEAVQLCFKALSICKSRDEHTCLCKAHLAAAYRDVGLFKEAVTEALDSLKLGRSIGISAEYLVLAGLGPLLLLVGDYEQSYEIASETVRSNLTNSLSRTEERSSILSLSSLALLGITVDLMASSTCPIIPSRFLLRRILQGPYSADLAYPMLQDIIIAGAFHFYGEDFSNDDLSNLLLPIQHRSSEDVESIKAFLDSFHKKGERLDRLLADLSPISASNNQKDLSIEAISRIGLLLDRLNISHAAILWHQHAEKQAQREGNKQILVTTLLRKGLSYKLSQDFQSATNTYRIAKEQSEINNLTIEWRASMFELARTYEQQHAYEDAIYILDELISGLGSDPAAISEHVDCLLSRGRCLANLHKTEGSIEDLQKVLELIFEIQQTLIDSGLRTQVKPQEVLEAFEYLVTLQVEDIRDIYSTLETVEYAKLWHIGGGNWMPPSHLVPAGWRMI